MIELLEANSATRFRPSDYSAAMVYCILKRGDWFRGAKVLDVGCGSGILLAAAGSAGASALCGVDIETEAVMATETLLRSLCCSAKIAVYLGELFEPVNECQFDIVLANLPQFPMEETAVDGRLKTWSVGGPDGRRLIDGFLEDLARHLAPGGHALITHNDFIDLERTSWLAQQHGLTVEVIHKIMVPLPEAKLAAMTPALLTGQTGLSIRRFGDHCFGMVSILGIEHVKREGSR